MVGQPSVGWHFLDESGNFDFTPKGTRHFVLSAVYTTAPTASAAVMQQLKYDLIAEGSTDLEFHASDNRHATRDRVTACIRSLGGVIGVHTVWCEKRLGAPAQRDESALLGLLASNMAAWLAGQSAASSQQLVMMFDSVLTGRQEKAFHSTVKPALKALRVPFRMLFHPVKSDLNGQVADYFSWSCFRLLESGDGRAVDDLAGVPWSQVNVFGASAV